MLDRILFVGICVRDMEGKERERFKDWILDTSIRE
jgi:hypothetical protein